MKLRRVLARRRAAIYARSIGGFCADIGREPNGIKECDKTSQCLCVRDVLHGKQPR